MAIRPIDGNELYRIEKLLDTDIVRQDKVALNLLEQVLYDIQHVPTLTPPNEPLTCEGCACESYPRDCYPCNTCNRNDEILSDQYRPPEGEESDGAC